MESQKNLEAKPKVAIIGGGAWGLVSARHLKDIADIHVYENKSDVGGLWNYSDYNEFNHPDLKSNTFFNLYGWLQGSIYRELITNNPKQWMSFKDFPVGLDYPHIMKCQKFFEYLQDYAKHFNLYDFIQFSTTVTKIQIDENSEHKYKVTSVPSDTNDGVEETIKYFDYVVICNGHHSVPSMPNFQGESNFEGKMLHVHSLRNFDKENYDGTNILIVGGSLSGWDVAEMLLLTKSLDAKPNKVTLWVKPAYLKFIENSFPEQTDSKQLEFKLSNISRITKNGAIFKDGSEENFDTIIYATGYKFWFPFFDPKDNIIEFEDGSDRGCYFGPLYKKMFSINHPNIMFLGLIERATTLYITFERQALLVKQYIMGELLLPQKEDMLASLEEEKENCIQFHKSLAKFYFVNNVETYSYLDYHEDLCKLTNLPINNEFFQNLVKSDDKINEMYDTGVACRIKSIDWNTVFADFDYFSTSDTF